MLRFVAGIVCGVGVGFLIAPVSGEEARRRLQRVVQDPEQTAREAVTNIRDKAGEMGANMGRHSAEKAVDRVIPERFSSGQRRSG